MIKSLIGNHGSNIRTEYVVFLENIVSPSLPFTVRTISGAYGFNEGKV